MSFVVEMSEVEALLHSLELPAQKCTFCENTTYLLCRYDFEKNREEWKKLPPDSVEIIGEIYSDLNSDGTYSISHQCEFCLKKGILTRVWTYTPSKYT